MLYDRWRQVARDLSSQVALRDLPSARQWTFAELAATAETRESTEPVVFPRGSGADFIISVLRAWRYGQITCPLETTQAPPQSTLPPANIVHLKVTSATTGAPKLVAFTAEQLAADARNIVATMKLRRDWPNLAFISLAHSYGFSNLVTPLLLHGIPLVLGGAPLPEIVRSAGEGFPHLTIAAVPALWRAWHEANAIPESTGLAISAGAPLPLALEAEVFQKRGLKIHNFYGASECGGIAFDRTEVPRRDASCVGTAMENVAVSVSKDGCLEIRGDAVASSYWPPTSDTLRESVYVASDLAELRNGCVFLRGRATDVINVAGRKVSPESIERLLSEHAGVRECLVFGVTASDDQRGENIVACVSPRNGVSVEELRQFLLTRSESWQVPRDFWFVESLQVNERGKLPRAEWRRRYLERTS